MVTQTQSILQEIEQFFRRMRRHWLIRKYVEQADVAASNKTSRVKKP